MPNRTDFVSTTSSIGLFNVYHYIVSLGIIFSQTGLIKNEEQNQTAPVFNGFFQYLNESNATEAKVLLLREMSKKAYGDKAFDIKYVNETYEHIINEGLFPYYGNMTGYISIRNFARNSNFTVLKKIVFDDLSKNYINNVSCSLENVSSKRGINLSPVAIDNLFADYLWSVFRRDKKNFRQTENNLENVEKRELQIYRRLRRQVSDNDDSDDSSNFDMYFAHFSDTDKEELLKAANENLYSDVTEENQFWTVDNNPTITSQVTFGTAEPNEAVLESDSNLDFQNPLQGNAEDAAIKNSWPTFAESNLNYWPFVDTDSRSHPKIRRIDISTKFPGFENEISRNEDEFSNNESGFQVMTNVQNNRVLGNPGFEIDVEDVDGTSTQSEDDRIERFLRTIDLLNRERLGITDERDALESLGSDDQYFDVDNRADRKIWYVNDVGGNGRFTSEWEDKYEGNIHMAPPNENIVPEDSVPQDSVPEDSVPESSVLESSVPESSVSEDNAQEVSVQDDTVQECELNIRRLQVDYAGRREPVYLVFRNMEIDTKSKRMQSIAKAAIIISSNESINHTFEDSLKMLKGYILKLEKISSLVPTYKKLAIDFCENNLKVPEEYNFWKIPNHPLIDDVLFETNFYEPITEKQLNKHGCFQNYRGHEKLKSLIDIYENSPLLQKSLRLQDFVIIRKYIHHQKIWTKPAEERLVVALYRLALRECEEEWMENHLKLYNANYYSTVFLLYKTLTIGGNYTFEVFTKFSSDEILEDRKLSTQYKWKRHFYLKIELDNAAGTASIDRISNTTDGTHVILLNTLKITNKNLTKIDGTDALILKLEDKRSKEEKMIDIIKKLYHLVASYPDYFKYYN